MSNDIIDLPLPGLPGLLGIHVQHHTRPEEHHPDIHAELIVRDDLLNPAGTIHAATVVALADTACGYGCLASLPTGKTGFTTLELKTNHLGTTTNGAHLRARAYAVHRGSTTQVWDATVTAHTTTNAPRKIAEFRCTQYLLAAPTTKDDA